MRIFHCDHCGLAAFFENTFCGRCGHKLAFLPDLNLIASLDPAGGRSGEVEDAASLWTSPVPRAEGRTYRLCENYAKYNVCNWAMGADDPNVLCASCRLTRVIPDLNVRGNLEKW